MTCVCIGRQLKMLSDAALIELRAPPAGKAAGVVLWCPGQRGERGISVLVLKSVWTCERFSALAAKQGLQACLYLLFCVGSSKGIVSPRLPTQLGGTSGRGTRGAVGCSRFCLQQLPYFSYSLGWQDQLSFAIFKLSAMLWWRLPAPQC